MGIALRCLSEDNVDACVSAGNTGALMALGRHFVGTIDGVKRPAICRAVPTRGGSTYMLDLGANSKCDAQQLSQFAVMGAALARIEGLSVPKLALLNIGTELSKGNEVVRETAQLLRQNHDGFDFVGYIEGDNLFSGKVDVIVCDGFTGNIALKVSEGLVKHLIASLIQIFDRSLAGKALKILVSPVLKSWSRKKNPSLYNGAAFLGLKKTVVKSHGAADELGLITALQTAREHALANIPAKIRDDMAGREFS
jgi:glycerol-3-phosphate acyltransferase PlsX